MPAYLSSLGRRTAAAGTRTSRAITEAEVRGSTYRALIETYRQLCAERRKMLEDLIRWMDEHGGIRRRGPVRDGMEVGSTE